VGDRGGGPRRRRGRLIALAAVLAVAVAGVAYAVTRGDEAQQPELAQLWVDPDGGSCTRHGDPVPYAAQEACATPAEAWRHARAGDAIVVKGGRYRDTTLAKRDAGGDQRIVLRAARGERAVLEEVDLNGVEHVTLRGFRVEPDRAITDNNDKVLNIGEFARDVRLERITMDLLGAVRDGLGISGGVDGLVVAESDLCCNAGDGGGAGGKLIQMQNAGDQYGPNRRITLDRNRIHTNRQGTVEDHMECLYIAAVTQLTLSRNHFYDCALNTIEGAFGSVPQVDWTIENNVFEHADLGVAAVPLDLTACNERSNWVVQYNYLAVGAEPCDGSGVTFRGNIGRSGGCQAGAVYEHNVWADAACSPTDRVDPAVDGGAAFAAPAAPEATGPGDYRPASASAPQVGAGDPASCPATDQRGAERSADRPCDAGPLAFAP
jgi:hypothetical protein